MAKMGKKDRLLKSAKKTKFKGSKVFKFMDTLNLYTRLGVDRFTNGSTDIPDRDIADGQFYYATNRIFTRKSVKKMYFLTVLPDILPRGFITDLREDIMVDLQNYNEKNRFSDKIHVNLIVSGDYYKFNKAERKVQGKWKHFTREFEKVSQKAGEKTLQDELKSDVYSEQIRRKVNSFLYIKEATEEEKASLYKSNIIIELVATNNESLSVAEECLQRFIFKHEIKTKDVFIQTNAYNKAFTPVSVKRNNLLKQMHSGDVLADDTLTSLSLSTHGVVGDKTGIYHGIDVFSRKVVALDFSKGSDSNNILLTASTGEGKSNYAKMLYTFISSMKRTYSTIIFDYEGTDYIALGKVTGAKSVSFSSSSGSYVNTIVIGDLTGDKEIDNGLLDEARDSTKRVFDLLVSEDYKTGMDTIETAIFSEALKNIYETHEVFDGEPETYKNSKDLTLFMVFSQILKMRDENKYRDEFGYDEMNKLTIALKPYFEAGQIHSNWFGHPVSVQELIDSDNIIFNFGMAGKDDASKTKDKKVILKQIFAGYLTMLLSGRNKVKGKRTVVFIEEMQRYLQQVHSGQIVNSIATGGRKLGIIAYYITNDVSKLIDMEKSYSGDGGTDTLSVSALLDNLNVQIIGATGSVTMEKLINRFGLENSASYLEKLVDIRENNKKKAELKYCFHISYKGQSTLVRMLSHPDLDELPLYSTLSDANQMLIDNEDTTIFKVGNMVDKLDEVIKKDIAENNSTASWYERLENDKNGKLGNIWTKTGKGLE